MVLPGSPARSRLRQAFVRPGKMGSLRSWAPRGSWWCFVRREAKASGTLSKALSKTLSSEWRIRQSFRQSFRQRLRKQGLLDQLDAVNALGAIWGIGGGGRGAGGQDVGNNIRPI